MDFTLLLEIVAFDVNKNFSYIIIDLMLINFKTNASKMFFKKTAFNCQRVNWSNQLFFNGSKSCGKFGGNSQRKNSDVGYKILIRLHNSKPRT
ncbi:hypothetical protein BpHYR1_027489 [Brachionus plicatilis]|uniref:Uncharacterized protein n=1 Tax=Brachionus plicatilis TaxID=10195 RepID=A0A3M7RYS1_BRAPC|nr:hypothetical protein BpHYR1_027489 [Brachionus plicatilis]